MIGATSQYVTTDLDTGLVRRGRDVKKIVLARAIWAHLQRKVIVDDGRTIVFS